MIQVRIKRVFDPEEASDGFRVLVDRLWPRGIRKEQLLYDAWAKDITPSTPLRQWFHQDETGHWAEFVQKYRQELSENPAVEEFIDRLRGQQTVTLLYASKNATSNHALSCGYGEMVRWMPRSKLFKTSVDGVASVLAVPPYAFATELNLSMSVVLLICVLHSTNNSLLPAFTMISTSFLSTLVLKGKRQFMQIFFVRFQWFSILAALYSNHPELKANSIA